MNQDRSPKHLPPVSYTFGTVFDGAGEELFFELQNWSHPIHFFVGPNGSGKTRTARVITADLRANGFAVRYLQAERLLSFHHIGHYGGGFFGPSGEFKGFPLDEQVKAAGTGLQETHGMATGAFYILRDHHDIRLRITALLRHAFGRHFELSEVSGLIQPVMSAGGVEYPLLQGEGQGLKELVVLLASIYDPSWQLLVVDEPELHLHPAATSLLIGEIVSECARSGRRALVVTHEPRLVKARTFEDMAAIWVFRSGARPKRLSDATRPEHRASLAGDLAQNTGLISDLVFSPHPVLVEGETDVAALSAAALRLVPGPAAVNTEFVKCGGASSVARWFEIAHELGLRPLAIADLDALFEPSFARAMDMLQLVKESYALQWQVDKTHQVLRLIHDAMRDESVPQTPAARRDWLAKLLQTDGPPGHVQVRAQKLLAIWRDAGVWLHSLGDLEATLGLPSKQSSAAYRAKAGSTATQLDSAVTWAVRTFDLEVEITRLVQVEVERIAQYLQRYAGLEPSPQFATQIGPSAVADSRLVEVKPLGPGRYRIVVKLPPKLAGYWVEFDRDTSPNSLALSAPHETNTIDGGTYA